MQGVRLPYFGAFRVKRKKVKYHYDHAMKKRNGMGMVSRAIEGKEIKDTEDETV